MILGPVQSKEMSARDASTLIDKRGHVLLIDGDALTRWSVATYLSRWFVVEVAESPATARQVAGQRAFFGVVMSDQIAMHDADAISASANERNPHVRVVRTVVGAPEGSTPECLHLEKPFNLAELAQLLGVPPQETATA
jgi:DNA-binding NtrC family response regulator